MLSITDHFLPRAALAAGAFLGAFCCLEAALLGATTLATLDFSCFLA